MLDNRLAQGFLGACCPLIYQFIVIIARTMSNNQDYAHFLKNSGASKRSTDYWTAFPA
jgi:hypothetical protein